MLTSGHFAQGMHYQSFRIYYEDTDAARIVYYANYLKYAERARTDALRCAGISQSDLLAQKGIGFVVRRCILDFESPAGLDDEITVETRLLEIRKVRMSMEQRILKGEKLLVRVMVDIAMIDHQRKPARIPDTIVQALQNHLTPQQGG